MKTKIPFIVLFFLFSSELLACQCPGNIPFEEDYQGAASIVLGRVIGRRVKTYHYQKNGIKDTWTYFEYRIKVKQTYKGDPVKILRVATAREGAVCAMRFRRGKQYLVYAHADKRYGLYTSACNRNFTRADQRFKEDRVALQEKQQ